MELKWAHQIESKALGESVAGWTIASYETRRPCTIGLSSPKCALNCGMVVILPMLPAHRG